MPVRCWSSAPRHPMRTISRPRQSLRPPAVHVLSRRPHNWDNTKIIQKKCFLLNAVFTMKLARQASLSSQLVELDELARRASFKSKWSPRPQVPLLFDFSFYCKKMDRNRLLVTAAALLFDDVVDVYWDVNARSGFKNVAGPEMLRRCSLMKT